MKHISIAFSVVAGVSTALYLLLTFLGVSKAMAIPLATSLFGLTMTVEAWFSRRANSIAVAQSSAPNADRYSIAWPRALTLSVLLYIGLGQLASAFMVMPTLLMPRDATCPTCKSMMAGFLVTTLLVQAFGSLVIGKSLGQRAHNCGWIVIICGVFFSRLIAITADYVLIPKDIYLQLMGLPKSWLAYGMKLEISFFVYLIPSLIGYAAGFNKRQRGHLLFRYDLMTATERDKLHRVAGMMQLANKQTKPTRVTSRRIHARDS